MKHKVMPITVEFVDDLFKNLSNGNGDAFFANVAEDVNWTVLGTHPLAGVYNSKAEFLKNTFERLSRVLKGGVILKVNHILVSGDIAVVEMTSTSITLNGKLWPNTYCWILRFVDGIIKEVRAYVDSYLVQQVIDENE
jgi:uncharacterized protein